MSTSVSQLFDLHGHTAIITGGSRGLGLQSAEALGEAGARLVLIARNKEELEQAAGHLGRCGIDASWITGDSSRIDDVNRVCDEAIDRLGHIDILVNSAGSTWGAPAEIYPMKAWDAVFDLNVRGLFGISQRIARMSMIPRRQGRIINMGSILGLRGNMNGIESVAYNASKGAVHNVTRALAAEWGEFGITVNAIAPGFFPSRMTRATIESLGLEKMITPVPLRRLGDEDDIKGAILLFASQAGKHITGQVLPIDGGHSATLAG